MNFRQILYQGNGPGSGGSRNRGWTKLSQQQGLPGVPQAARHDSWTAGACSTVGPNYRSNKVCLECLKLLGMTAGQLEHVVL
jgi:hypothetical protein